MRSPNHHSQDDIESHRLKKGLRQICENEEIQEVGLENAVILDRQCNRSLRVWNPRGRRMKDERSVAEDYRRK